MSLEGGLEELPECLRAAARTVAGYKQLELVE
jgi:hypothetical protein